MKNIRVHKSITPLKIIICTFCSYESKQIHNLDPSIGKLYCPIFKGIVNEWEQVTRKKLNMIKKEKKLGF